MLPEPSRDRQPGLLAEPPGRRRGSYAVMTRMARPLAMALLGTGLAACSGEPNVPGWSAASAGAGRAGSVGRAGGSGAPTASGGKGGAGGVGASGSAGRAGGSAGSGAASGAAGTSGGSGGPAGGRGGLGGASGSSGSGGTAGTGAEGGEGSNVGGAAGDGGPGSEEIPAGYVKAIVGVGYGGIRILSRDGGMTWGDRTYAAPDGGDDEDLLRAVAYGKGRWIATGWKLMTSDDGVNWVDRGMLNDGIIDGNPIIEGLAYKDGYFYAAGDGGSGAHIYRSADGLGWSTFGTGGDTVKHTGLTYHDGLFVSYGDSETSYQSTDAKTWTEMGIDNATFCEGEWRTLDECHDAWWFDDGYYLVPEWGGDIRRSTTGSNFQTVYSDDQSNTLYRARAVAEGYAAPE